MPQFRSRLRPLSLDLTVAVLSLVLLAILTGYAVAEGLSHS